MWKQVSERDIIVIFFSDSAIIICHIFVTIVKYMVTDILTLSWRIASLVRFLLLHLLPDTVVLDETRRLISLVCFFDVAHYPHNFFFDA